jgi:hypothetical protein
MSPARVGHAVAAVLRWIEPEENPSGVVYGTIAVGAVLAAEAPRRETFASTLEATLVTLALYWCAHTYARVVGGRLDGGERLGIGQVIRALAHEWAIVKGAALPIAVLVVARLSGVGLEASVNAALWTSAASLAGFETVAAARGRGSRLRRTVEASLGFVFGGGLLLLHLLLH